MQVMRSFSTNTNPSDGAAERASPNYVFKEDEIKGTTRGKGGLLLMAYTCGVCDTK